MGLGTIDQTALPERGEEFKTFISKEKLQELLSNKPPEVQAEDLLLDLEENGYEVEGYNTEFSPLSTVKNIPSSLVQVGKDVYSFFRHLKPSIEGVTKVGAGLLLSTARLGVKGETPSEAGEKGELTSPEEAFYKFAQSLQQRYGSREKILETIERDPAGFLSDIAPVVGAAGKAVKTGGKIAKAGRVVAAGEKIFDLSRKLEPASLVYKTARKTNEVLGVNKLLQTSARRLMQSSVGLTTAQAANLAKAANLSGNPAKWLAERGIHGSLDDISNQLGEIVKNTRQKLLSDLSTVPGTHRRPFLRDTLTELNDAVKDLPKSALTDQRKELAGLLKKHDRQGLTLSEIQKTKENLDDLVSIYQKSGEAKAGIRAKGLSDLRKQIRSYIEVRGKQAGIADVRKLNQQTQTAYGIKDIVDQHILGGQQSQKIIDLLLFSGGLGGAVAYGNFSPILASIGVIVPLRIARTAKFKSTTATVLQTLSGQRREVLARAAKTGKWAKAAPILKDVFSRVQHVIPEIRLAGKAGNEELLTEEMFQSVESQIEQLEESKRQKSTPAK